MTTMNLERFEYLADAYGADLRRWPEAEREAALEILANQMSRYPRITPALLRERIADARERGHVVLLDVVVERMGGIAVPILDPEGRPVAALSIAALNERILSREAALAQALLHESTVCQVRWAEAMRTRMAATRHTKETAR